MLHVVSKYVSQRQLRKNCYPRQIYEESQHVSASGGHLNVVYI